MADKIEYISACLFGLEKFVSDEIEEAGYEKTGSIDGRVMFTGDESAAARFNIRSRYAERLYIKLGEFAADSFDALFEGTKSMPWERWIGKSDAFPVKGHSVRSKLTSIPDCQRIIKKAAADRLTAKYGAPLPETGAKYQISFFIFNDIATLMIDTTGAPLHKRGYRTEAVEAPLRETLAAAMVKISRPREDVLLWDPMCGSGTIPIEAALMMTNTAPGMRRPFAAETFAQFPKKLWANARAEAADLIISGSKFESFASDIDRMSVETAKSNIRRAGMEQYVKAFEADALSISADGRRGTIVTNPPYGERLLDLEAAKELTRKMGRHFATLGRWQIYIISSLEDFDRLYGRRPDKIRKLYNGMIKCNLYQYFKSEK